MKKILSILLISILTFSLSSCGNTNKSSNNKSPDMITENVKVENEEIIENKENANPGITTLKYENITINIPQSIMELITIKDAEKTDNPHMINLFDIYETASIEAGQKIHPGEDWGDGWLFGISIVDQIGFEEIVGMDIPGYTVFAKNNDKYYIFTQPTDVRLMRENNDYTSGMKEWSMLCEWAHSMMKTIIKDNDLLDITVINTDYTYDSKHKYYEYKDEYTHSIIILSQPVQQGDNGIWCVERVEEYYNNEIMYTRLIFPVAMGIEKTAHQYYVELQEQVDNGQNLEALNHEKVLREFLNSDAWYHEKTTLENLIEIDR